MRPEDRPAFRAVLGEHLRSRGNLPFEYTGRCLHKDGSVVWILCKGKVVERRGDGAPERMVGCGVDVTALKTDSGGGGHELRRAQEQLLQAQKRESIGRLAGGIAHDFNNLLMAVNGFADLVLEKIEPGHAARGDVEEILRAGTRAAEITRQLLAFSRRQVLQPKRTDLNRVVGDMQRMLKRLIGEDIELKTVLEPRLDPVVVDPAQVEQVLLNLSLNARDAMRRGGALILETADVKVGESLVHRFGVIEAGDYVLLAVSDTGAGISPEVLPHLFEPFFTTKSKGEGSGLGLSVVYGIVRQSGGHVTVYSEIGRGSTFKIYFPCAREPAAAAPEPAAEADALPLGLGTILLAEDDPSVRKLLRAVLEGGGYSVLEAAGGAEAEGVAASHAGTIHLLLTDVVMPGIGGVELARKLRERRPELPIVFMSGYTPAAAEHRGVPVGEALFLDKPVSPGAVLRAVHRALVGKADELGA